MRIKKKKVEMLEHYDKDVDILSFYWGKKKGVKHSRELKVNILIDFDKKDDIVGIEIWDFLEALKESQKEIDKIFKKHDKKQKKKKSPKNS